MQRRGGQQTQASRNASGAIPSTIDPKRPLDVWDGAVGADAGRPSGPSVSLLAWQGTRNSREALQLARAQLRRS